MRSTEIKSARRDFLFTRVLPSCKKGWRRRRREIWRAVHCVCKSARDEKMRSRRRKFVPTRVRYSMSEKKEPAWRHYPPAFHRWFQCPQWLFNVQNTRIWKEKRWVLGGINYRKNLHWKPIFSEYFISEVVLEQKFRGKYREMRRLNGICQVVLH